MDQSGEKNNENSKSSINRKKLFGSDLFLQPHPKSISVPEDLMNRLFKHIDGGLEQHKNTIDLQFRPIVAEIGLFLKNRYGIDPDLNHFTKWFIDAKLGGKKHTLKYNIDGKKVTKELILIKTRKDYTISWDDLVEYCEWLTDYLNNSIREKQRTKVDLIAPTTLIQIAKSQLYTDFEKKEYVRSILAPLGGFNPQYQRIMDQLEFERLIDYTNYLVLNDTLPIDFLTIKKTEISIEHIRFTYYRLHKKIFGTKNIHDSFITFLHSIFSQFENTALTTTRSKFSNSPKSYYTDFAGYIGDES